MKTLTHEQLDQVTGGIVIPPFVFQTGFIGIDYGIGAVNLGPGNSLFGSLRSAPFRGHLPTPTIGLGAAGSLGREDC